MINSYEELVSKVENLDLGESSVKIAVSETYINLVALTNPSKDLMNSEYWLDKSIGYHIKRSYDAPLNKWKARYDVLEKIKQNILSETYTIISKCSGAKMPERTSLYKDYKNINNRQYKNPEYYTDIISVINYYQQSRTDSICKSNVIGLLELLRKKYNGKSS